ncbi:MAG: NAD(P)/FAD-dependent oxidoreductase [Janthinobacterium lividum]
MTTVIWAAGIMASDAAKWLGIEPDRRGRAKVDANLDIAGHPEIFVIGDTADVVDAGGKPVPGVAAAAKQQGQHVARALVASLGGTRAPAPFRYRNWGNLATVGRKHAVVHIGMLEISGVLAWLLWSTTHIYFLVGFRNRLLVGATWLWNYLTFERGARLITGLQPEV